MKHEYRFLSRSDLARLKELHLKTKQMNEVRGAMASECCQILQVPDDGSDDADLARSIVEFAADPDRVIVELFL